jgi:acetoin utilization protein AcuC
MDRKGGGPIRDVLVYSPELAGLEYSPTHPFKPMRAKLFVELLHRYLLIHEKNQKIHNPKPLDEELLYLFHERSYIDILKRVEEGALSIDMLHAGLGTEDNPVFPGLFSLSLAASGGTHDGAMMLLNSETRFAFNPVGGFHHAGSGHAEGFCYLNDIALTIKDLLRRQMRIAYIDIDAHHGNGVQDAFYDDNRVLFISFHESGKTLYPGTGFEYEIGTGRGKGYTVNIPLMWGTDDTTYVSTFKSVVPPLVEAFQPDMVLATIGCDSHKDDPLAHLNITSRGYVELIDHINRVSPKVLAMGGGGYNVHKTASLWALAWARFCGLTPTDQFAGSVGGMMYGPEAAAGSLEDPPYESDRGLQEICLGYAMRAVDYVKEHVFPIHGIK